MNYQKKANEILVELFYENWMTKNDWETFNAEFRTFAGNKYIDLRQKRYCIKCNKSQTRDC